MKKWIAGLSICVAALLIWIFLRPSAESRTAVLVVPNAPLTTKPKPALPPTSTPEPVVKSEVQPNSQLIDRLPKVDLIREQVSQDPHAPPPAGAAFAVELADRIDQAIESEEASLLLLRELETCAANSEPGTVVASLQALCLKAALTLANAHPNLSREVEEIFERAEPETAALTRALER